MFSQNRIKRSSDATGPSGIHGIQKEKNNMLVLCEHSVTLLLKQRIVVANLDIMFDREDGAESGCNYRPVA